MDTASFLYSSLSNNAIVFLIGCGNPLLILNNPVSFHSGTDLLCGVVHLGGNYVQKGLESSIF